MRPRRVQEPATATLSRPDRKHDTILNDQCTHRSRQTASADEPTSHKSDNEVTPTPNAPIRPNPQSTPPPPLQQQSNTHILTQAWATTFYNVFVKRNSVYVATIFASAFVFDMTFETVIDGVWDKLNQGVSITATTK